MVQLVNSPPEKGFLESFNFISISNHDSCKLASNLCLSGSLDIVNWNDHKNPGLSQLFQTAQNVLFNQAGFENNSFEIRTEAQLGFVVYQSWLQFPGLYLHLYCSGSRVIRSSDIKIVVVSDKLYIGSNNQITCYRYHICMIRSLV